MSAIGTQVIYDLVRVAVSVGFLGYASWKDYQAREVSNKVWAYYAPIGIALTLVEFFFFMPATPMFLGLSIGVTVFFAVILFYFAGFGGADSKALMCIALALPFAPFMWTVPYVSAGISPILQYFYPLAIFINSVFLVAMYAVGLFVYNLVWSQTHKGQLFTGTLAKQFIGKKILVMFTGYKTDVSKLKKTYHFFPLEDLEETDENFKRKLIAVPKLEGQEKIVERLTNAVDAKKIGSSVWVSPGMPHLIFIFIGLFVALFVGDLSWILVRAIVG
jgi:archaeal preflagellin peptidase FlaK